MHVSIIMVSKDNESNINKSIESILSQKTQYDIYIELIIIDENSTDGTKDIIKEYQKTFDEIKLIENKKAYGFNNARNIGIKKAKGDFVGFIEPNDIWKENKIDMQIKTLNKFNKSILCFTDYKDSNTLKKHFEKQPYFSKMLKKNVVAQNCNNIFNVIIKEDVVNLSTILIRKNIMDREFMFNPKLDKKDDWDFLLKLARKGSFSFVNKSLVMKKENTEVNNHIIDILENHKDLCNEKTYKIAKSNCYARIGNDFFNVNNKKDASIYYYKSMSSFFQMNVFKNYFMKMTH